MDSSSSGSSSSGSAADPLNNIVWIEHHDVLLPVLLLLIPLVPYLVTACLTIVAVSWCHRLARRRQLRRQYDAWITRARQERRAKDRSAIKVLAVASSSSSSAASARCCSSSSPGRTGNDNDHNNANDDHNNGGEPPRKPFVFLTATETRRRILDGRLDPRKNIIALARRCRRYGRSSCGGNGDINNIDSGGVNAICEEFYDEAFAEAEAQHQQTPPYPHPVAAPLLYGVPISVKEQIAMQGAYSTGGLACRLRQRVGQRDGDALVLQQLRKCGGAIPLVTSNTMQILMLFESYNRIWGRTRNPWDLSRTPGGSSGGDAALVAMRCVPLAIASDIAGSIRIPASFCGVVGFKPTSTRVSTKGTTVPRLHNVNGAAVAIAPAPGPIATCVEDCALLMKAMWTPRTGGLYGPNRTGGSILFRGDLNVVPMPFNDAAYESNDKLTVGYFVSDGWFEPCVTVKRAISETIDALSAAGHHCVPFTAPSDGWSSYGTLVAINAADGNFRMFTDALEGEPMVDEFRTLYFAANVPNWLRWFLIRFVMDPRRGHLLAKARSGGISVHELWQRTADMLELRQAWSDAVRAAGVDAIIFPALPIPAIRHGIAGKITACCSYVFLANLLNWPSGTVPVTTVRDDEQHYYQRDELPHDQRDVIADLAAQTLQGSAGLPISVSVMTPSYRDETCLRVMREVERVAAFAAEPEAYKDVAVAS